MLEPNDTQIKKGLAKTVNPENDRQPKKQQVYYPDITNANTKFIVIVSLICLIAIFLLSILLPVDENATKKQPSGKTTATAGIDHVTVHCNQTTLLIIENGIFPLPFL